MRNIKEYKAPSAQITEFECADVITVSELRKRPTTSSATKDYVYAGSKNWQSGFGQTN